MTKPLLAALASILLLGAACADDASGPTPTASLAPTRPPATAVPAPTPQAVSGTGSKVLTIHLAAGRYRVTWTAQGNDNFIVILHGDKDVHVVNEIPPDPSSGEAFLSVADTSDYPLEVQAATLTWTLTFARV